MQSAARYEYRRAFAHWGIIIVVRDTVQFPRRPTQIYGRADTIQASPGAVVSALVARERSIVHVQAGAGDVHSSSVRTESIAVPTIAAGTAGVHDITVQLTVPHGNV